MKSIVSAGAPRVYLTTLLRSGYGFHLSGVLIFESTVCLDHASSGAMGAQRRLRGAGLRLFSGFLNTPFGFESWIPPVGVTSVPASTLRDVTSPSGARRVPLSPPGGSKTAHAGRPPTGEGERHMHDTRRSGWSCPNPVCLASRVATQLG